MKQDAHKTGIPANPSASESPWALTPQLRNLLLSIPLLFATLLPYIWLAQQLELQLGLKVILLGALGWWLALLLRLPVILAVKKKLPDQARLPLVLASGPAEEMVRLGLLV